MLLAKLRVIFHTSTCNLVTKTNVCSPALWSVLHHLHSVSNCKYQMLPHDVVPLLSQLSKGLSCCCYRFCTQFSYLVLCLKADFLLFKLWIDYHILRWWDFFCRARNGYKLQMKYYSVNSFTVSVWRHCSLRDYRAFYLEICSVLLDFSCIPRQCRSSAKRSMSDMMTTREILFCSGPRDQKEDVRDHHPRRDQLGAARGGQQAHPGLHRQGHREGLPQHLPAPWRLHQKGMWTLDISNGAFSLLSYFWNAHWLFTN